MAQRRKPVDVVLVGMGWSGAILAKELAAAGLNVVGLERGVMRDTVPDFQAPAMHDELSYAVRHRMMQDVARETYTFRNKTDQEALPVRVLGSVDGHDDVLHPHPLARSLRRGARRSAGAARMRTRGPPAR